MSFLQPWMLLALPLVALPIVIHLLNRRRYQTVHWGAMMFLRNANRQSRRKRRLQHLLIMAARMAAIAALIFAIGRPLIGGWLGILGGTPDTVVVVLDRSASMEQQDLQTGRSKRSVALRQVADTLRLIGRPNDLVLIDSATRKAQSLESIEALTDLPETGATDGQADVATLLQSALDYLTDNKSGRADVWICSDTHREDWNIDSSKWAALRSGFSQLKQGVRFHLLTYPRTPDDNLAVRVDGLRRRKTDDGAELMLNVRVRRDGGQAETSVPLEIVIDGARSVVNIPLEGSEFVLNDHRVPIDKERENGWGKVELPADANPRDNVFFFTYGEDAPRKTVIVADRRNIVRPLTIAAAPPLDATRADASLVPIDEIGSVDWEKVALVLWQAALPQATAASELQEFVDNGGVVLFFPSDSSEERLAFGASWGDWEKGSVSEPFTVETWRDDSGLLQNTQSGKALPVGELKVVEYRRLKNGGQVLARFKNGDPVLTRVATDAGGVYFCTTLPDERVSNLARHGVVLFVMIQRALDGGAARLDNSLVSLVGDPLVGVAKRPWQRLGGWEEGLLSSERSHVAGVYRVGDKLVARNRPLAEDLGKPLAQAQLDELFLGLDYQFVEQAVEGSSPLVSEIWRFFVIGMVLALLLEAWLCLPDAGPRGMATT